MTERTRTSTDGPILAIDTATAEAVVALGDRHGRLLRGDRWVAGFRHGEELLPRVDALLRGAGLRPDDLGAIAVGTGPGAFTGLRVGLATAKGLAVALRRPLIGIPSSAAFLAAARRAGARDPLALLLPAGPNDRVIVVGAVDGSLDPPMRLAGDAEPALPPRATLVAIDLPGRSPEAALELGARARLGLAEALISLAAARWAAGETDPPEEVDAEYVTLPRGVDREGGPVSLERV